MIFFTADQHYNHKKIIGFEDRPFSNILEMETELIINHNKVVSPKDTTYFLGDFMLYVCEPHMQSVLNRMHGKKILIRGNHDRVSVKKYLNAGFEKVYKKYVFNNGDDILLIHNSYYCRNGWKKCICGHSHKLWKTKKVKNVKIINCGVDVWDFKPVSLKKILNEFDKL